MSTDWVARGLPRERSQRTTSWIESPFLHLAIGALCCFFVLSPALFTPWDFGPDYTNHLWLIWHQGLAISAHGHPTLYLQSSQGIFEPLFAFYGGTVYAIAGAFSALLGGHPYPVYLASIGAATAMAYGGMWWIGRQAGLSRMVAHLPAFVVVTAAYYLTDIYARGAWTEFVALSAVPLFVAGAICLLSQPWRPWAVALFVIGTVLLTGTHNITLLWSMIVIGPMAVVAWIALGKARPAPSRIVAVAALALAAAGINAWFLLVDLAHSNDVRAWVVGSNFNEKLLFFDNVGNVLDPLRHTPLRSTTPGLTIAAPIAALAFSVLLVVLVGPGFRMANRTLRAIWIILLAVIAALIALMVMPGSWWVDLGSPFTTIQFPYRLAGWLLLAIAAQLCISLRFAGALRGRRLSTALIAGVLLVGLTVVQATAQLYPTERVDKRTEPTVEARTAAFAQGPTTPPVGYYSYRFYGDISEPLVKVPRTRVVYLPVPEPGDTRDSATVTLPPGSAPIITNVAAGPYLVKFEGMKRIGRSSEGLAVLDPGAHHGPTAKITVVADAGGVGVLGTSISILCLIGCLCLIGWLVVGERLHRRRSEAIS